MNMWCGYFSYYQGGGFCIDGCLKNKLAAMYVAESYKILKSRASKGDISMDFLSPV